MGEIKLKPCPFCGGKAYIQRLAMGALPYFVECGDESCIANGISTSFKTERKAAEAWNKRAGQEGEAE